MVISRGQGVRVFDDQGKEYIEGVAGLWCASLGFCASGWRAALRADAQAGLLPPVPPRRTRPAVDLAEKLLSSRRCR